MHVIRRATARVARAALALAAVPVVAFLTTIAAPGSATAASGGILVSTDGVSWQTGPVAGPLPAVGPLVPGGTGTWTVHVRNASPVSAAVQVALQIEAADSVLLDHLELAATAAGGAGEAVTPGVGVCEALLDGPVLAPGETVVVTIAVSLDASTPNAVQGASARSRIFATLVEDADGARPAASCPREPPAPVPPQPPAAIARTGGGVSAAIAVTAALCVVPGLVAVVLGRRRREGGAA